MDRLTFDNSKGVLNKSTKRTNPKAPEFYGYITLDEPALKCLIDKFKGGDKLPRLGLAGWVKKSDFGSFISLRGEPPYDKEAAAGKRKPAARGLDDEIPF
mgnify:CR=1 FL=1